MAPGLTPVRGPWCSTFIVAAWPSTGTNVLGSQCSSPGCCCQSSHREKCKPVKHDVLYAATVDFRDTETATALLPAGADPNVKDKEGKTETSENPYVQAEPEQSGANQWFRLQTRPSRIASGDTSRIGITSTPRAPPRPRRTVRDRFRRTGRSRFRNHRSKAYVVGFCKGCRIGCPCRSAHSPTVRCWRLNRRWIFSGWNESIAVGATPVVAQYTRSYLTQTGLAPGDKNWEEKRGGGPPFGLLPLRCMPLGYSVYSGPPSATISATGVR